jgi:hypothetical protein
MGFPKRIECKRAVPYRNLKITWHPKKDKKKQSNTRLQAGVLNTSTGKIGRIFFF